MYIYRFLFCMGKLSSVTELRNPPTLENKSILKNAETGQYLFTKETFQCTFEVSPLPSNRPIKETGCFFYSLVLHLLLLYLRNVELLVFLSSIKILLNQILSQDRKIWPSYWSLWTVLVKSPLYFADIIGQ